MSEHIGYLRNGVAHCLSCGADWFKTASPTDGKLYKTTDVKFYKIDVFPYHQICHLCGKVICEGREGWILFEEDKVESFLDAYITCALWSETDESDDSGGKPLDANYSRNDLTPETLKEMTEDCQVFMDQVEEAGYQMDIHDESEFGHNFWLSRNEHGAGFFDNYNLPKKWRDKLQAMARKTGRYSLIVGDDGRLYGHRW